MKKWFKSLKYYIIGAGSIFNIYGDYHIYPCDENKSDAELIKEDWEKVGNDLKTAIGKAVK